MRLLKEADLSSGSRAIVRIDTDVAITDGRAGEIYRLKAALPTIRYLAKRDLNLTLIGHLGRPNGRTVSGLRLLPVARRLAHLLVPGSHLKVEHRRGDSPVTNTIYHIAKNIVLWENLRFDAGEEANEPEFIRLLANEHDLFVNDSFASAHRRAASTVGLAAKLPSYAGLRLADELAHLALLTSDPSRPFGLIIGGAKVEEKLGLLAHLLPLADYVLTGGVVANMLLKANTIEIKNSLIEPKLMATAQELKDEKIILPEDFIWQGDKIVDLGPQTVARYQSIIKQCQTIFWAGSLGRAEERQFALATNSLAATLAKHKGIRVIGGGDTAAAIERLGLLEEMSFVSTGGGSALEYLAGKRLPAITALGGE